MILGVSFGVIFDDFGHFGPKNDPKTDPKLHEPEGSQMTPGTLGYDKAGALWTLGSRGHPGDPKNMVPGDPKTMILGSQNHENVEKP